MAIGPGGFGRADQAVDALALADLRLEFVGVRRQHGLHQVRGAASRRRRRAPACWRGCPGAPTTWARAAVMLALGLVDHRQTARAASVSVFVVSARSSTALVRPCTPSATRRGRAAPAAPAPGRMSRSAIRFCAACWLSATWPSRWPARRARAPGAASRPRTAPAPAEGSAADVEEQGELGCRRTWRQTRSCRPRGRA